ncbi:MAG: alpha-L-fucosidase [Verrucomicrobiota bacterium]
MLRISEYPLFTKMRYLLSISLTLTCLIAPISSLAQKDKGMDEMWGDQTAQQVAAESKRGLLFKHGNYAMFIHFGLYSQLANKVDGKTYYGIGEWIMSNRMAKIPPEKYKQLAKTFNPKNFDAKEIAALAKDAGMKYIVITAKHHDGFALFDTDYDDFNIVDATPFGRDPMHELAQASRDAGLGFGFYYSQNQDWTSPGAQGGPQKDANGKPATFTEYFYRECLPQVKELTSNYGPLEMIWFDTPGNIPKKHVMELVDVVKKNQPTALMNSRIGQGLGDYVTLGDMEVPMKKVEGLWESVDTTNTSWAYAWYDEDWKSPREILKRLVGCVGRGGTYMLNIGPRGDGSVPKPAALALKGAGAWIQNYPQVIYHADPSPWNYGMPWGDITANGSKLFLSVFDWPASGQLFLAGLKTEIKNAKILQGKEKSEAIGFEQNEGWTRFTLPDKAPEKLASVIELELAGAPEADSTHGLDPNVETSITGDFAKVDQAKLGKTRWMGKFGEWYSAIVASNWQKGSKTSWDVSVLEPGYYQVQLSYRDKGLEFKQEGEQPGGNRIVWAVEVEGGQKIQNQLSIYRVFKKYAVGWLHFPKAGRYKVHVSNVEGASSTTELKKIHFKRVLF